ncbi:hypothetical protein ENSA5_23840 [Enhygromyxa salina]|uniref:Tat (Twin-arginine translocation) pathway signal sequence domain protein n=1 Tax=Enhygromyxa salina TaxID=215803 RepID=A0A2S9YB73_9BACT|nr:DUF1552 domain-containing protein [Enhygromyxa salina]PRQ02367.1 hypothetical protein ENSA5_23840 [Enhygromyxa salina]
MNKINKRPKHSGKFGRRTFLAGAGGVAVGLPFLEGLVPREARAGSDLVDPFAIFFRQANGVAAQQSTALGDEPERFWPTTHGPLTPETVAGRAIEELSDHLDRLLVVSNVNANYFDYADGHANGALQGLTAQGPVVPGQGGDSEANGESLDHRIGRELNPDGRDSLFLYSGKNSGWLGGPCVSYRGPGNRRAALHNPLLAYQTMMGLDSNQLEELIARQTSVNDMVRDQLQSLVSSPKLSSNDHQRLQLHLDSIRDLENNLTCSFGVDELAVLEGLSPGYDSDIGDEVLTAAMAHMHVAALAVACGYTRSVCLQIGSGNDGSTRYRNLDDNSLMENYHYVSHRRASHDNSGDVIANADLLHSMVDRQFAQTFKYLLDLLEAYELPDAARLIDCGVCLWYNDNGNGPAHTSRNLPTVMAGGANGFLKQGLYMELNNGDDTVNHARLLNTIGSAAGLRDANDEFISDFGDPNFDRTPLLELLA